MRKWEINSYDLIPWNYQQTFKPYLQTSSPILFLNLTIDSRSRVTIVSYFCRGKMYNNQNRYNGGYDDLFQRLSKEYVWKEATNRLAWFEKYYERCYAGKIPSQIPPSAPVLIQEIQEKKCIPIKYTQELPPQSIDEQRRHVTHMKPIPKEIEELIVSGTAELGKLKARKRKGFILKLGFTFSGPALQSLTFYPSFHYITFRFLLFHLSLSRTGGD